jgi:hypothetical protein
VLAGVVLWVVRSAAIWRAPVVLVTAVASVVFFVVPAALAGLAAPRYAVIPALLLLSLVAYMIDGRLVAGWGALAGLRWPAVAAVVLAVVVVGANFRVTNERSAGPRWSRETDAARDGCAHSVQGDARVAIAPADWTISIPCGAFAG